MILFGIVIIIGTFVFTSILLFATEIFPSKVSATALGLINIAGQLGIFSAPYLVTFGINNQIYPLALMSCLMFVLIVIPICMIDESRVHKHHEE